MPPLASASSFSVAQGGKPPWVADTHLVIGGHPSFVDEKKKLKRKKLSSSARRRGPQRRCAVLPLPPRTLA